MDGKLRRVPALAFIASSFADDSAVVVAGEPGAPGATITAPGVGRPPGNKAKR
jgi:hypothetical protein